MISADDVRNLHKLYGGFNSDNGVVAALIIDRAIDRLVDKLEEVRVTVEHSIPPDWRQPKLSADQYVDRSGVQRPRG